MHHEFVHACMAKEDQKKHIRCLQSQTLLFSLLAQSKTKITITLMCPITKTRIRQPIRGKNCTHLQCFDLANYVKSNYTLRKWRCPLCNKPTLSIRRCPLFQALLRRVNQIDPLLSGGESEESDSQTEILTQVTISKEGLVKYMGSKSAGNVLDF